MGRDNGFSIVDHDPRFVYDTKIRRLRRDAPDEGEGAIRTMIYLALRDTSWSEGERVIIDDADSPYEVTSERVEALRSAGLIDVEGRIRKAAWESWFEPARMRREHRRESGRRGGLAKARQMAPPEHRQSVATATPDTSSNGAATPSPEHRQSSLIAPLYPAGRQAGRQTVRTDHSDRSSRVAARDDDEFHKKKTATPPPDDWVPPPQTQAERDAIAEREKAALTDAYRQRFGIDSDDEL